MMDADCAAGRYCALGSCIAECASDLDCADLGDGASYPFYGPVLANGPAA